LHCISVMLEADAPIQLQVSAVWQSCRPTNTAYVIDLCMLCY